MSVYLAVNHPKGTERNSLGEDPMSHHQGLTSDLCHVASPIVKQSGLKKKRRFFLTLPSSTFSLPLGHPRARTPPRSADKPLGASRAPRATPLRCPSQGPRRRRDCRVVRNSRPSVLAPSLRVMPMSCRCYMCPQKYCMLQL